MKKLLIFLGALAAYGTDCTISDTVRTPFGGYFAGRIVVALNSPGSAQPLYSGSQTLTGWQKTIEVPASANGAVAVTLVCTDTITPSGTSYSARYQPTSGSGWAETWSPATGTTTIRAMRATTVPTPTTTFQASQLALSAGSMVYGSSAGVGTALAAGSNGQVLALSGGYPAWTTNIAGNAGTATALAANGTNCAAGTFPLGVDASGNSESCTALPTTISGTANQITASASTGAVTLSLPTTITGLTSVTSTGFTGALTGNASTATALATPRTIAGVSFNGTANISIASTNLSDTANIVRNNAANTYTAGSKQTFAHSATTAGLNVGVQAAAPSSPAQGDVFFNSTLTRKGVYDGTQWRYELYAPSSGTGVVSWDGTALSASTTLAGLSSVTSTAFVGALTGNASTATALSSTVASGRLWIGQGTGVPTSSANLVWDTANDRLGVGIGSPRFGARVDIAGGFLYMAAGSQIQITGNPGTSGFQIVGNDAATTTIGTMSAYDLGIRTNSSTRVTVNGSSGNLIVGGTYTTDLGYGLHAANKATNGNLLVFDPTATTGTTKAVFKAGQGQISNIIEIHNSAGSTIAFIDGNASVVAPIFAVNAGTHGINSTGPQVGTGSRYLFGSGAAYNSTPDLSLSRASAGVLQVGDGGANANGYLSAARLGVGTASPATAIHIVKSDAAQTELRIENADVGGFANRLGFYRDATVNAYIDYVRNTGTLNIVNAYTAGSIQLATAGSTRVSVQGTTGNITVGTTTDGNYKLEVANSGSSGTLRVYDQTATTGNTKEVIRAGAGQSTNLTEWQNNAGTVVGSISLLGVGTFQDVISNGSVQATADFIVANGSQYRFNTRGKLYAQSDGVFTIWDHAQTSFNRLQFGGSTSSFPSLKRSSAILQARLADDSAYTDIGVNAVIVNKAAPSASSDACTAGQLWAGDMGGTKYAFYCVASGTIVRSAFASF